jgi:predicted PurR-regulated permease PerM
MARAVESPKTSSRFVVMAAICIVVAALYFAQVVLIPLALSLLFSFLLAPVVTRLERYRLGRVPSVVIVTVAAVALVLALGAVVVTQVINLAQNLPKYRDNIIKHVNDIRGDGTGTLAKIGENVKDLSEGLEQPSTRPAAATSQPTSLPATQAATQPVDTNTRIAQLLERLSPREDDGAVAQRQRVEEEAKQPDPQVPLGSDPEKPVMVQVVPPKQTTLDFLIGNSSLITEPLGTAGLVIVFVIFMLLQREDLRDRMIRLVGKGQIHLTTTALDDAATRISRYLMAMSIVNGTYGLGITIGLWLIGKVFGGGTPFPSVVLWGLLCAVLRFIPYIGPWIAAAFPIALSFAVYESYTPFIAVVLMFVIVELISNNLMEPWLYGSSTGMSTLAIIVAAVFWTWLWGATGLLLATPLTVCLVVIGKYVPQLAFLDILLGDEQVLETHARVYQRLLALDQEEAAELAEQHLEETSLERVYDEVLIPALALAEQDRHKGKLDEQRQTFVYGAMRDMIEELGDRARVLEEKRAGDDIKEAAAANVAIAKGAAGTATSPVTAPAAGGNGKAAGAGIGGSAPASAVAVPTTGPVLDFPLASRPAVPKGCVINVVCLPARDEGDDIANLMLAQLLQLRGYCSFPVPVAALASEMLDEIEKREADLVVVSALPPGAVSYSRYLCKRVHARFAETKMAVGLWTIKGDLKKARERITCAADVQIATTLGTMLDTVHQIAQPMILRAETGKREPARV